MGVRGWREFRQYTSVGWRVGLRARVCAKRKGGRGFGLISGLVDEGRGCGSDGERGKFRVLRGHDRVRPMLGYTAVSHAGVARVQPVFIAKIE
ncbi:hypothetical protein GOBAR_AA16252 [Gossypium barbadense]|uniref:Uncharacterized protein n=1 Tax=Gossypium barbadense TaxID=3634 RepID=A0A2P5XM52_GOSBA|nr:hypothetical protein GOBAR_AA16252 [Gossypium barbadense]